jgi:hypothetical protein
VESINNSATTNGQHAAHSNHYGGTAVDINKINGENRSLRPLRTLLSLPMFVLYKRLQMTRKLGLLTRITGLRVCTKTENRSTIPKYNPNMRTTYTSRYRGATRTATRGVGLAVLWLCLMLAGGVTGQQCRNVRVANVRSIFAIAPSPAGADVLFYGSTDEMEGELVTGNLFRLRLNGKEGEIVGLKSPDASNPPAPVWKPDGSFAYFETDQGIYQVTADTPPELLWKGPSDGMAISPDGFLLAFWRVEKGADSLVLYDLTRKSEARTWRVPDRFESDKTGWSLAFAPDGHALYARTYDETSNTPLKRFDITSGKITAVSPNCSAVAESKDAVYFIAVSTTARSLHKIAPSATGSSLVTKDFHYDCLLRNGNPRWLTAQNYRTREIVVLDTQTDTIRPIGKHDSAAVLSDGNLLVVSGSEIAVGAPSCSPGPRE